MADYLEKLENICQTRNDSGLPLYQRLIECMSQMIASGDIADGLRLPPDVEVAAHLGISHITWAKVLNELKKRKLVERSRLRGTFARRPDSRLNNFYPQDKLAKRAVRGKLVAVLLDDIDSRHLNLDFMNSLQDNLQRKQLRTVYTSAAQSSELQFQQTLQAVKSPEYCGGIIWSIMNAEQVQTILQEKPDDFPLTFIYAEHYINKDLQHDFVHYDGNSAVSSVTADWIRQSGKKIIFLVQQRHMHYVMLSRINAIEQAINESSDHNCKLEVMLWESAEKNFEMLLDRQDGSLLIVASPTEMIFLQHQLQTLQIAPQRLLPAVGISVSGMQGTEDLSMPCCYFDSAKLAQKTVDVFWRRLNGDKSDFQHHHIGYKLKK